VGRVGPRDDLQCRGDVAELRWAQRSGEVLADAPEVRPGGPPQDLAPRFRQPSQHPPGVPLEPVPLVLCSAVILLICTSRGLGLALVAVAKARMISVASILSAVVGTASFLMLAKEFGVSGGFAAEILAEFTGLLVQVLVLFRLFRRS